MEEFKAFSHAHFAQMEAIGFPKNLHSSLYKKLTNEEYDIGTKVKIVIDKDNEKMMVTPIVKLDAEEDVYLIDHAWTFRYYEAYEMLKENKKLRYRMRNIMNYPGKIDITNVSQTSMANDDVQASAVPEEYKEEKLNLLKYLERMPDGPTIYNLDEYGIVGLQNIPFKEDATEISLFGNKISDPYTITDNLFKFTNLKALWLNDNPIEESCQNFDEIGEFLESLEIINSKFTSRAGEWALLFCAKDQNVEKLEDIEYLDLSSRDFLKMKDLVVLDRLTKLHTLDISDHTNLSKSLEEVKGTENKEFEGQEFKVTGYSFNLVQFLSKLPQVKNIICDDDVAEYFIDQHNLGKLSEILPNIETINKYLIPTSFEEYKVEKEVSYIFEHMWKYACTYRFSTTANQKDHESYWYIMDEVGSAIQHSDDPNVEIHPFIYCKDLVDLQNPDKNAVLDPSSRITYSILWPKKQIEKDTIIYRDFLPRITEDLFRSARLCVWFMTPDKYYKEALETYKDETKAFTAQSGQWDDKFILNQEHDKSHLDELKDLDRPVKLYVEFVSFVF